MAQTNKVRNQQIKRLINNITAGPDFLVSKDMVVESLFRNDGGNYINGEFKRKHDEWVSKLIIPEFNKLIK